MASVYKFLFALGTRTLFFGSLVSGRLLFLGLKSTWFGIFWEILPETFPYPALSGLTVDTWLRQFMRRLDWTVPTCGGSQVQFLAGGSHARYGVRQWRTRPSFGWVTPAIRAEKGWRGRRESDSQVTCHPN